MPARLGMVLWDIKLQIRSHLYSATAFTTATLCLVAYLIHPLEVSAKGLSFLLFADPAVIGLTFVGAFVLMERGGNTLVALSTTPLEGHVYVLGKLVSFSILGTISGGLVAVVASGGDLSMPLVLIALVLTNVVSVLIGFGVAARTKTVNAFLVGMTLVLSISALAFPLYFSSDPGVLLRATAIIPTYSILTVLEAGFPTSEIGITTYLLHAGYLCLWGGAGWMWALRAYDQNLRGYEV